MCGIAGIVQQKLVNEKDVEAMTDIMAHRGRDGEGKLVTMHGQWYIGLGHRRLAIIDLSDKASQPMVSDGVSIVYNGEVYNFKELRSELEKEGCQFRSKSDTEVVLNAHIKWRRDYVDRFNGMFACAIYNRDEGKIHLVRDRYGIKPLYYSLDGGRLLFASEIKAILRHKRASVDYGVLDEYFTFQNIFSDGTMFRGIKLLPAGTVMSVDLNGDTLTADIHTYWDCSDYREEPMAGSDAVNELVRLFNQAVQRQLVGDVEIGTYLSGGMDTNSIAAVATKSLPRIRSFTCGFDETSVMGLELGCDERMAAEVMASAIESEHYEVVLHAGDMEVVMPKLVRSIEDLRMGQSYPNYYAARLASRFVKVVLSGTGGDELFGGYPWRYCKGDSGNMVASYYHRWQRMIPEQDREWFFSWNTMNEMASEPLAYEAFSNVFAPILEKSKSLSVSDALFRTCLLFELKTFLHGLFVVDDKLSMAHSLEVRVPFLDNDLVDFALRLPSELKVKLNSVVRVDENVAGNNKWATSEGKMILREAMRKVLPREILERRKQGFSSPDGSWYRGRSMEYLKQMLLAQDVRLYEYINRPYVEARVQEHLSGKRNHRLLLWSLLCFELWLREFV